jgi:hypothetical protein
VHETPLDHHRCQPKAPGNGLLLFFRVDDYERAQTRAEALVGRFEEEPRINPNTQTMEFSLLGWWR